MEIRHLTQQKTLEKIADAMFDIVSEEHTMQSLIEYKMAVKAYVTQNSQDLPALMVEAEEKPDEVAKILNLSEFRNNAGISYSLYSKTYLKLLFRAAVAYLHDDKHRIFKSQWNKNVA